MTDEERQDLLDLIDWKIDNQQYLFSLVHDDCRRHFLSGLIVGLQWMREQIEEKRHND